MILGNEAAWQAPCSTKQSLLLADGLFLKYDATLESIDPGETPDRQLKENRTIMEQCVSVLELRIE